MPDTYPVVWNKTAERDLFAVIQSLQNHSPSAAHTTYKEIMGKATELELLPEQGRIAPELLAQGVGHYRELLVSPWLILYRLPVDIVYVLAVIDGRRNVEDILLDRLIRITYCYESILSRHSTLQHFFPGNRNYAFGLR